MVLPAMVVKPFRQGTHVWQLQITQHCFHFIRRKDAGPLCTGLLVLVLFYLCRKKNTRHRWLHLMPTYAGRSGLSSLGCSMHLYCCGPVDILFQYGVVGILLFAFLANAGTLLIAAILCTLIYCGKQYWNYADDKKGYKKFLAVTAVEKKFKQDSTARAKKDSFDRTKRYCLAKRHTGEK